MMFGKATKLEQGPTLFAYLRQDYQVMTLEIPLCKLCTVHKVHVRVVTMRTNCD